MTSLQPDMYIISPVEAHAVQTHGVFSICIETDLFLLIPINSVLGMIREKFFDQYAMAQLRLLLIRIGAQINNGI